jgi:hypothetical protein
VYWLCYGFVMAKKKPLNVSERLSRPVIFLSLLKVGLRLKIQRLVFSLACHLWQLP